MSHHNQSLLLLLRLMQVPNLGANGIYQLLSQISLNQLLDYDAQALQHIGWNQDQIQRWFRPLNQYIEPALLWQQAAAHNHIIDYFHPDYPELLKQVSSAPPLLFVQGNPENLAGAQIAIVGSRHCSHYGEYWAKHFASELWAAGFMVTSGLAIGIDGFAHQAVVEIGGKTIAVLGSGLNKVYPARHQKLARDILENEGCLLSEFLPDQPPLANNFPRRNRIISGLSLGTLIIEANQQSGSLITARYAMEQNREVFAIPGNLQNSFSQGCHHLIKQGAFLVENVADIIENLSPYPIKTHGLISPIQPKNQPKLQAKTPQLSPKSSAPQTIQPSYPELYQLIGYQPISVDQLAERSNLAVEILLTQLLSLELEGLVEVKQGCYQRVS